MNRLKYNLLLVLLFLYNITFAQFEGEEDLPIDVEAPGAPEIKKAAIDFYQIELIAIAVLLILGYSFYKSLKRT